MFKVVLTNSSSSFGCKCSLSVKVYLIYQSLVCLSKSLVVAFA